METVRQDVEVKGRNDLALYKYIYVQASASPATLSLAGLRIVLTNRAPFAWRPIFEVAIW